MIEDWYYLPPVQCTHKMCMYQYVLTILIAVSCETVPLKGLSHEK